MARTEWEGHTKDGFKLRQFEIFDIKESYLDWLNSDLVMKYSENTQRNHTRESAKEYLRNKIQSSNEYFFLISDDINNVPIGSLSISIDSQTDKTFDMGYIIGDQNYWGKNAGTNAIALGFYFCFEQLHLRKHFGGITSTNVRARFAAKKLGIKEYAKMREKRYINNSLVDMVLVEFDINDWIIVKDKFII